MATAWIASPDGLAAAPSRSADRAKMKAMRYWIFTLAVAIVLPALASSQSGYPRTRRSGSKANPAPPSNALPTPTFEGTLKMMTHKEVVIQLQSEQTLSIRRDRKTKFFENEKEIKPESIAVGTPLAI